MGVECTMNISDVESGLWGRDFGRSVPAWVLHGSIMVFYFLRQITAAIMSQPSLVALGGASRWHHLCSPRRQESGIEAVVPSELSLGTQGGWQK